MRKYRMLIAMVLLLLSSRAMCQGSNSVEMADVLRSDGKIYAVVFGLVVILTGLIIFVLRVERKVTKLENEENLKKKKEYSADE